MNKDFDIAIVGSGFSGSLMAMAARRLGRSVILIERGKHPRFAIGESSTPLANLLIEEFAQRYDLPRLLPLAKWGTWQRTYPEIGCGLKRGFTFYHHRFGEQFGPDPDRRAQLLVAASPRDGIADTHWYRSDFDHFLLREAEALGAEYLDETQLAEALFTPGGAQLRGSRRGKPISVSAGFVIDASGPRGCLHRLLSLPEEKFDYLPATQTLFSHFTGVRRLDEIGFSSPSEVPPYPVDDAAVHHVFDGGWMWVLRFNNGLTSAGVAATDRLAKHLEFTRGAEAWHRLLQKLPSVAEQFHEAKAQLPFMHIPRLAFRSGAVAGPRWVLLPSAAGFIDPLLSTGFPLTLLGISRLARILEADWESKRREDALENYARQTIEDLAAAERLVAALYATFQDFAYFVSLALLYFAAVSFSETARRLGRIELASSFLLRDHPTFATQARECCELVLRRNGPFPSGEPSELHDRVLRAIEPIDVIGLSRADRRNWYPAEAADALAAAHKLGVTPLEMKALLARCGFM